MVKSKFKIFFQKWSLAIKIVPIIIVIVGLKLLSHKYDFELITLNALFTSLVAGTIFLIGFLISGVLSDYKESEKIPGEMAAALESMHDEAYTMYKSKNSAAAKKFLVYQEKFLEDMNDWF